MHISIGSTSTVAGWHRWQFDSKEDPRLTVMKVGEFVCTMASKNAALPCWACRICGVVAPSLMLLPTSLLLQLARRASSCNPALPLGVDGPMNTSLGGGEGQAGNTAAADLLAGSISRPSMLLTGAGRNRCSASVPSLPGSRCQAAQDPDVLH